MDFAAALQEPEHRNLTSRAASSLALMHAAEIALIHLDLTGQKLWRRDIQLLGNEFAQFVEVERRRVPVYPRQSGG